MHAQYLKAQALSKEILEVADRILDKVGPGLLESAYENLLANALQRRGHRVAVEASVKLSFETYETETNLRADLLADDCVVVELKSVEGKLHPVYIKQTLTYMRLLDYPVGIIYNFGATPYLHTRILTLKGAGTE